MDWHQIFFGNEELSFFWEIIFRTIIMFLVVVITLNFTGKRGVKQLSIFEMVMIIALGSAAGDPMFYKEVGVLHAIMVFVVVLLSYRLVIWLIVRFDKVELLLEGKPIYLIKDGKYTVKSKSNKVLASDEFFAELRQKGIEHLGQVKCAVLETNGELNVLFFEDQEVKPGLPIWPEPYFKKSKIITNKNLYACGHCGYTEVIAPTKEYCCQQCTNNEWVVALDCKRTS